MTGWIGDFFRFWWALCYWNLRKSWFHLRGAERDTCPCQNPSDSGHALDSRCEAVVHWNDPRRFRRVCPLLARTPSGWRCSVDAERVRPYWGRAAAYALGTAGILYLVGTLALFGVLRATHYPVDYLSVAWPPHWKHLRAAQEQLFAAKAREALARGNFQQAILSLERVYQLNPQNYSAGLALAGLTQAAAQADVADHLYERLMRDVPDQRTQTARLWFRSLLARAAYDLIKPLAVAMLSEDPGQRNAWLNALVFSARKTNDGDYLAQVLRDNAHLPPWCTEIIATEQLLLQHRLDRALSRLMRVHRQPASPYVPFYQVDRLIRHGRLDQATALLDAYGAEVAPDESAFLRLRIDHVRGWTSLIGPEFNNVLEYPMAPRIAAQCSAYLIGHPDPTLLAVYCDKFLQEGPKLDDETIGFYHATYLAAALAGDRKRAERVGSEIAKFTGSDNRVLHGLVELLRAQAPDPRLPRILPLVPLPTEVVYEILDRSHPPSP